MSDLLSAGNGSQKRRSKGGADGPSVGALAVRRGAKATKGGGGVAAPSVGALAVRRAGVKAAKGVRRKSPLRRIAVVKSSSGAAIVDAISGVSGNSLTPRGHFAGQEIMRDRQHLDPDELRAFFKALSPTSFWYPYFYIQYFYGCRLSEPALILDEDVSLTKRHEQIIIRRLKKAQEESGFREHVYMLDPRVIEVVKTAMAWKEHKKVTENPFLFASNRRRTSDEVGAERLSQLRNIEGWQSVSRFTAHRVFCKIAKTVKIPENLQHSVVLRHTRAVVLLSSGAVAETVMHVLGHSSMKMTCRYLEVAEIVRGQYAASVVGKDLAL